MEGWGDGGMGRWGVGHLLDVGMRLAAVDAGFG